MLKPIPVLRQRALEDFGPQKDYGEMLVGDQVKQ